MMIRVIVISLLLFGCAEKGAVQVDWEKAIKVRLKGEVERAGDIDMRWVSLPPLEEGKEKEREEKKEEELFIE